MQNELDRLKAYFPYIASISYKPTKVVNDKVYDIAVSVEVLNPLADLAELEVRLVPVEYEYFITDYGMRQEDYPLVFPPEEARVARFKPRGAEREEFEAEFKNLVGGREYTIEAEAKDFAGQSKVERVKTEYIRQYENFGKELYERGIIVAASYMPWNFKVVPMKDKNSVPLLGRYDTSDDIVIWKHIDLAGYAGINCFLIDGEYVFLRERDRFILPEKFLEKGIKVGVFFGSAVPPYKKVTNGNFPEWAIDLSEENNHKLFVEHMKIIASTWADHPNYIKINNKPLIFIYDSGAFVNISKAFKEGKEKFVEITGQPPYIMADEVPKIPYTPDDVKYILPYKDFSQIDALTGWAGFHNREKQLYIRNYEMFYMQHLSLWKKFADIKNLDFVPSIIPGYDDSYSWGSPLPPIERSPEKFEKRIRIALNYLGMHKIIFVGTWNDFFESTTLEPSKEYGFTYLRILRDTLLDFNKGLKGQHDYN